MPIPTHNVCMTVKVGRRFFEPTAVHVVHRRANEVFNKQLEHPVWVSFDELVTMVHDSSFKQWEDVVVDLRLDNLRQSAATLARELMT